MPLLLTRVKVAAPAPWGQSSVSLRGVSRCHHRSGATAQTWKSLAADRTLLSPSLLYIYPPSFPTQRQLLSRVRMDAPGNTIRSFCCTLHGAPSVTCFILGFSFLSDSSRYLPNAPSPDIKPFAGLANVARRCSAFLGSDRSKSVKIPARAVAWSDSKGCKNSTSSMGRKKKELRAESVLC